MSHLPFVLPARGYQGAVGLLLAAVIAGSWLGIHAWGMFVFELSWSNWPLALAMAMVQCWLSVGVFIVCHDAMHGTLAPGQPRLNAAIGAVLLALYAGFAWKQLRDAHFAHHRLAGHAGDPDFDEHNPAHFWRWYATFFRRYFGWRSILFVHTVVGIYWLVLDIPMVQIVLLYGMPALGSSLQLFYFGTFRPHCHREDMPFADRHNARSNDFGTLASLATCFHFGYHLEHHHRPDVPWWGLPAAKRAGVGDVEMPELIVKGARMSWLEIFLTVMSSLIGMELFAWYAHKYIMHGWGWGWHRDHHEPHDNTFEKNDLFAVVFGTINAAMYIYGSLYWDWLWWFAVGITLYGVIYTLVHDGLVHQRYWRWVPRKGYAKRLVQAHKLHHATIGKEGGVSFGFVFARDPAKLKAELKAQKEAGIAVVRDAVGAADEGYEVVGRNL